VAQEVAGSRPVIRPNSFACNLLRATLAMATSMRLFFLAVVAVTIGMSHDVLFAAQGSSSTPEHIAKVRAVAESRRNARRVEIKLVDGTTVHGRVVGVTDRDISVQPTPSDEPVMVSFDRIDSIGGPGLPRWTYALIGAGAIAGAIAIIASQ
jgi:hypothetical protein